MNWFLYDNGPRHKRVKSDIGIDILFFFLFAAHTVIDYLMWLALAIYSLNLYPYGTMAISVGFLHLCSDLWLQQLCKSDMWLSCEVVNFVILNISGVHTHGAHQPVRTSAPI